MAIVTILKFKKYSSKRNNLELILFQIRKKDTNGKEFLFVLNNMPINTLVFSGFTLFTRKCFVMKMKMWPFRDPSNHKCGE